MNQLRIIVDPDERIWDDFVAAYHAHVLQSAEWGELKSRFGWSAHRFVLTREDKMIAGAQILFRRLPLGLCFAYIPRGPVVDYDDKNTVVQLFDAIYRAAKSRGAFALKIEPNCLQSNYQHPTSNIQLLNSNSIQPRTTIHLDLTHNLDTILAQMKAKWRYNIRLAERKGVVVREGNRDDVPAFYRLMQITSERDKFAVHSVDYYRTAFELFTARDYARLFVAEYESEPLAMIFVTAFGGEAIYLYGASSNAHRERMPNHALHWAAIQWAKERECVRYDLWGLGATTEADAQTAHGLYQFKQGFGGEMVKYGGGYDAVFSTWRYALYQRAVEMRRGELS